MRIVVTGALGHIGSRLIRSLPTAFPGAEIVMIDDLSTQRYGSLFDLPPDGRYRFRQADILQADLDDLFGSADAVVHLAAITNAEESFTIKESVEHMNVHGTELVARACLRAGARLIFLSTTSVYGTQDSVVDELCPVSELKPQSPYAASKLRAEQLLARLAPDGLRAITFRFGTIVGASPGMRFHTAVNKFCWQAVMGEPLTVWRTALHQRRPYLDLTDAINAIEFVLARPPKDGLYNVVTKNASVAEIAELIGKLIPDLIIKEVDSPVMNQLSYEVDDGRFRGVGFEVRGDLGEAIRGTVERLKGSRSAMRPVASSAASTAK